MSDILICDRCGKEIREDDVWQEIDDKNVCQKCIDSHYHACDYCEDLVVEDNMVRVISRYGNIVLVCKTCREDYCIECDDCGEIVHSGDAIGVDRDRRYVCQGCYDDHYTTCDGCGTSIHEDDANRCDDCEDTLCGRCWESHYHDHDEDYDDEDEDNGGCGPIYEAHYKPAPEFYVSEKDNSGQNLPYVGVEVEVENKQGEIRNVDYAQNNLLLPELYCKWDGSLSNGFEIVSHPMTLNYHKEFKWEALFDHLQKAGYRAHDTQTCGLHLHYSKRVLSQCDQIKLGIFVNMQIGKMEVIGRRSHSDYARFKDLKIYGKLRAHLNDEDRYEAVNWNNRNTVEFRFPRGTLNYSTFIATVELIFAVTEFVKVTSMPIICNVERSWDMFTDHVKDHKEYGGLLVYLKSKNLVKEIPGEILAA